MNSPIYLKIANLIHFELITFLSVWIDKPAVIQLNQLDHFLLLFKPKLSLTYHKKVSNLLIENEVNNKIKKIIFYNTKFVLSVDLTTNYFYADFL